MGNILTFHALPHIAVEAVAVVVLTHHGVVHVALVVGVTDGGVEGDLAERSGVTLVLVVIRSAQDLVSLQSSAPQNGLVDGIKDVVSLLPVQSSEVVSVDLPDKCSLQSVMVGVSDLDVYRVLVIVRDPVSALVHVR